MGKKWWYTRGLQVHMLLVVVCLAQSVAVESVAHSATQKGKTKVVSTSLRTSAETATTKKEKGRVATKAGGKSSAKSSSKLKRAVIARAGSRFSRRRHGWQNALASSRKRVLESAERTEGLFPVDDDPGSPFLFSPERAPFAAQLNEERLPYRVNSVFVLPAEQGVLEVGGREENRAYLLQSELEVTQVGPNIWSWQAPRKAGVYPIQILHPEWGATLLLNVFVMVPSSRLQRGYLNGYRIGTYPTLPFKQLPMYTPPRGFIEVTSENENVLLSPHFRLRQFLCKQEDGYPKYLALDRRLLIALEFILEKLNKSGYHSRTFSIMSGYRTPYYNRAIGNSTTYSRHSWGDAADIFIDENPRDGKMDDLNKDGVVDFRDAAVLYDIIEDLYQPRVQRLSAVSFVPDLIGGLARYRETGAHGPFVHVDVRGIYARWGQ